jgi:hypothetical protein
MYTLLAIDALFRIVIALAVLTLGVPALARARPRDLDRMEWFWWCLAAVTIGLTLFGQALTHFNLFSTITLVAALIAVVLLVRARLTGRPALTLVRDAYGLVVVSVINILEGRVNVRRRLRRSWRALRARGQQSLRLRSTQSHVLAWGLLIFVAAALRLVRPFVTANLGFSDTYAHLYLFRLLERGLQVDPAWGPYPRGMHFLLMSIHELTNVDPILLLNFFGPLAGVLMTVAVADAARRLGGSLRAGIVAGLLFATMTGGAAQYFVLGGSVVTTNAEEGRSFVGLRHAEIPDTEGEFDVLETVFLRQTATLPQELAIVFLFPAALFLLRSFREDTRSRWASSGYFLCTAAIAAVHPGVAVPLVLLSGLAVLAGRARLRDIRNAMLLGVAGILTGSTWMLAFIRYARVEDPKADFASGSTAGTAAAYYFPFLREGDAARVVTWVSVTPVLIGAAVLSAILIVRAMLLRERRTPLLWTAAATLLFLAVHVSSRYGLPELVEIRRNSSWLAMMLAILFGVAVFEMARLRALQALIGVALLAWLVRVPVATASDRIIHYSGYSAAAYTVLDLERRLEPFTWTLVTYGQEFPMVLGKGFHLSAADFLDTYDPADPLLRIPTKYVYVVVEKVPHRFQINTWAVRFSRTDLQRRLQTWCFLYGRSHRNIRIHHDDEQVRVYVIERSDAEVKQLAEESS